MRVTLLVIVVALSAALVSGCGGGAGETVGSGNQTFTVPSDVHDVYGEIEAILDQLPYQGWYTRCVVKRIKGSLSPAEAEALAELPESEREGKASRVIAKAGPACEQATGRPVIDPNASETELDLYRAGHITPMRELAEGHGMSSDQVTCVEAGFEELPAAKIVALGNGSPKVREGILLSVFKPCAKVK